MIPSRSCPGHARFGHRVTISLVSSGVTSVMASIDKVGGRNVIWIDTVSESGRSRNYTGGLTRGDADALAALRDVHEPTCADPLVAEHVRWALEQEHD